MSSQPPIRCTAWAALLACACASSQASGPPPPSTETISLRRTSATTPPDEQPRQEPPTAEPKLEPLTAPEPFIELELADAKPAVVSLPIGATGARPVLVATHGAGGRATTHCALWRSIVGDRGFVLCPRGVAMYPYEPPHESGYYYDGHPALAVEISKALDALVKRFGTHVDVEAPVFAGYSQGANMGSLILPTHAARFANAVLWEGGVGEYQEWNLHTAERFRARGGRRVLLACGRADCYKAAQLTAHYMKRSGLEPRVVFVAGAGHTHAGKLRTSVKEAFAWLIENDDRW